MITHYENSCDCYFCRQYAEAYQKYRQKQISKNELNKWLYKKTIFAELDYIKDLFDFDFYKCVKALEKLEDIKVLSSLYKKKSLESVIEKLVFDEN